jgi:holin-like protein
MLPCLLRIMLFLLAGELTVSTLNITFPASLCGMLYFLAWLKITGHQSSETEATASGLVGLMGLLFVPAGAAIISFTDTLRAEWPIIAAALVVSTALSIVVAGRLADRKRDQAATVLESRESVQ